jgi:hypothetical protein
MKALAIRREAKDLHLLAFIEILQMLRVVYPERANCRPFASLRVTAKGSA